MVELHAHTTASDGVLTPAELVAEAASAGITTLAVTDHDTLEGAVEARRAARTHRLTVVPGIELSVRFPRGTFHLLGYLGSVAPPPLVARLGEIQGARTRRNEAIVARLGALGAPVRWEHVAASATGRVGRPHIADALVAAGHVRDRMEAFERFLGDDAPAYISAGSIDPAEAIRLIRACGGVTALAHPRTLRLDLGALDDLVGELAAAGLDAVEAHRGDTAPDEQEAYRAIARRHGLLATGGSDFHGPASDPGTRILGATGDPGADPAALDELIRRIR